MSQLREIIMSLDERLSKADEKNKVQKEIFVEYIRIFQKLAQKLALLSNRINEQVISSQGAHWLTQTPTKRPLAISFSTSATRSSAWPIARARWLSRPRTKCTTP